MATRQPRLLVAEDNSVMADVMKFNLEQAGYDVVVTADGGDALDLFRREHFDLVISDFQMPGLSGEELCRGIRCSPENTDAPFVLVTAKGLELDVTQMSLDLSITRVLSKPFSPREIVRVVKAALEAPQTRQRVGAMA